MACVRSYNPGEYKFKFGVVETAIHGGGYVTDMVATE
jgi:hypothetical protein